MSRSFIVVVEWNSVVIRDYILTRERGLLTSVGAPVVSLKLTHHVRWFFSLDGKGLFEIGDRGEDPIYTF